MKSAAFWVDYISFVLLSSICYWNLNGHTPIFGVFFGFLALGYARKVLRWGNQ